MGEVEDAELLSRVQDECISVAESLAFAAPELWPMHVQRIFDVAFEGRDDRPIIYRED